MFEPNIVSKEDSGVQDNTIYDTAINPSLRNMNSLAFNNNDYMKAYYGDIKAMKMTPEIGFFEKYYVAPYRALGRGTLDLAGTLTKGYQLGRSFFEETFSEILENNVYKNQREDLLFRKENGEINDEQYNLALNDLEKAKLELISKETDKAEFERKQTLGLLKKTDLFFYKAKEFLHLKTKKGESQILNDIFESAPTTLAAIGLSATVKNPAVTLGFLTVATGTDIAQQELEAGEDVVTAMTTGGITGFGSSILEYAGQRYIASLWNAPARSFSTKSKLFNKLNTWVAGKPNGKDLASRLGVIGRATVAAGGEELTTETAQAAVETYLPRFLGQGTPFTSLWEDVKNISYQGFIGAISGSMFGGVGTTITYHNIHKGLKSWALDKKVSEQDAKEFADTVAPILVEHNAEIQKEIIKEISTLDTSDAGVQGALNIIQGGLTSGEKSYIRQSLLDTLNKKNPNQKVANAIAADVLATTVEIEATISQKDSKELASQYNVELINEDTDLGVSDKFYNSRIKKDGKETVQGAVTKDLASNVITLLNDASPDTIIHESAHLLLKAITRAINATSEDAFKHSLVNNIVDLIGLPEDNNNNFSEEQHENFALYIEEYAKTGVSPNAELALVFKQHKRIMDKLATAAEREKVLTKKGRSNLDKIFAQEELEFPEIDINEENVKVLKEAISNIRSGKTTSIKNAKILAQIARLQRAKKPIPIGYSVAEFIADNPEYNSLNAKQKRALLKKNNFEGADDKGFFPDDQDYISMVERNPESVFSIEDEKTKNRISEINKYNAFKELADQLFPKNINQYVELQRAINTILRSGDLVITDKNFLDTVSDTVKGLIAEIRVFKKEELGQAKKYGEQLIKSVKNLLPTMELTGIKISGIEKSLDDFKEKLSGNNIEEINKAYEPLRNQLEFVSNKLLESYIDSEYFYEQQGIMPPVANPIKVQADLLSIVTKFISEGATIKRNSQAIREVRRMLIDHKISGDIVNAMVNKLISNNASLIGEKSREDFVQSLIDKVNQEYSKDMQKKINSYWSSLVKKANKKKITYKDQLFVKWVNDNIVNYKKHIEGSGKSYLSTAAPLYFRGIDLNKVSLGKDPVTQKDILMNEQQRSFVNTMENYMLAKDTNNDFPVKEYAEMYKDIARFSYLTSDFAERVEMEKKEKIKKAVVGAIETVSKRKDIPFVGKLDDLLFAGPLSGLRSNLIKVFGTNFADVFDVLIEEKQQTISKNKIYEDVDKYITNKTKGAISSYYSRLNAEKSFSNAKEGTIEYELKDYTRGQLINIWILSKNEIGKKWIENNFGEKATNIIKVIDKRLSKIDKSVAEYLMGHLKRLYPDINRTYFEINGIPMGVQSNYWPIITEVTQDKETEVTDLNSFEVIPQERKEEGFQKKRVGPASFEPNELKRMAVFENPMDTFRRYVNKATNYIYVVPKLNMLSKILNGNTEESKLLNKTIEEKFGESTLRALKNDVKFLMGFNQNLHVTKLEKVLNEIVSNAVVAKLGLKAMVGIKQVPAAINFMSVMPKGAFLSYLKKGMSNPKKTWKYMMNHESVRDRFRGQELPMFFADNPSLIMDTLFTNIDTLRDVLGEKKLAKTSAFFSEIKSKAMLNVRLGDIAAVIYGGYAYEQYLREKINADPKFSEWSSKEKETYIEQRLIEVIETTQQSGLGTTKGGWHQSNGGMSTIVMRSLLTFSSANAQFARKVREAAYEYRNGNMSKDDFLKTVIVYYAIQPTLYSVLSSPALYLSVLAGILGMSEDDDKWKEEFYLALIRPYIDNVSSAGGNLGNIITFLADNMAEVAGQKTYGDAWDITPFVIKDISKAIKSFKREAINLKKGKKVDYEKFLDLSLLLGEDVSGVPLQTFKNMLKGVLRTGKGTIDPENREEIIFGFSNIIGSSENQTKRFLKENE